MDTFNFVINIQKFDKIHNKEILLEHDSISAVIYTLICKLQHEIQNISCPETKLTQAEQYVNISQLHGAI